MAQLWSAHTTILYPQSVVECRPSLCLPGSHPRLGVPASAATGAAHPSKLQYLDCSRCDWVPDPAMHSRE